MYIHIYIYTYIYIYIHIYTYIYIYIYISATGPRSLRRGPKGVIPGSLRCLESLVYCILRGAIGSYSQLPAAPRMNFLQQFFMLFFMCQHSSILSQNLAPTWSQHGPPTLQLGAKIHQKSAQEPSKMHPKSHLVFDHFLDGFLVVFWWIFDLQIHQKSIKNDSKSQSNNTITKVSKNH